MSRRKLHFKIVFYFKMIYYDFMKILDNMQKIIKEKGLTQDEAADLLGISQTTLNLTLNGKRNLKVQFLESFAQTFHIPITELFDEKNVKQDNREDFIEILEVIEKWLNKKQISLTTRQKVELVDLINDEIKDTPKAERETKIIQFADFLQKGKALNQ